MVLPFPKLKPFLVNPPLPRDDDRSAGFFDYLHEPPSLILAERPRLHQPYAIADCTFVVFVVRF
jgi:hypothetical protein